MEESSELSLESLTLGKQWLSPEAISRRHSSSTVERPISPGTEPPNSSPQK